MRNCDRCGRQLNDKVKFCIYCGNKLTTPKSRITSQERAEPPHVDVDRGIFGTQKRHRFSASSDPLADKPLKQPITQTPPTRMTPKQARKALNEIDAQQLFDLKLKPKLSRFKDLLESLNRRSDFSKVDYKHIDDYVNEITVLMEDPNFEQSVLKSEAERLLAASPPLELRILEYLTSQIKSPDLIKIRGDWEKFKEVAKKEMRVLEYIGEIEEQANHLDQLFEEFQVKLGKTSGEQISRSSLFAEYGFSGFVKDDLVPAMQMYIDVANESEQTDLLMQEIIVMEEMIELLSPPKPGMQTKKFSTNQLNRMIEGYFKTRDVNEVVLRTLRISLEENQVKGQKEINDIRERYIVQMWKSFNENESAAASIKIDVDLDSTSSTREVTTSFSASKKSLNFYDLNRDDSKSERNDLSTLEKLKNLKELQELEPLN